MAFEIVVRGLFCSFSTEILNFSIKEKNFEKAGNLCDLRSSWKSRFQIENLNITGVENQEESDQVLNN